MRWRGALGEVYLMGRLISVSHLPDDYISNWIITRRVKKLIRTHEEHPGSSKLVNIVHTIFGANFTVFHKYWNELGEDIIKILEPLGVEILVRGSDYFIEHDLLRLRKRDYTRMAVHLDRVLDNFRFFQPLEANYRGLIPKIRVDGYMMDEKRLKNLFLHFLNIPPLKFDYADTFRYSEEFAQAKSCFSPHLFEKPTTHTNELLARLDLIITLLLFRPVGIISSDIYL